MQANGVGPRQLKHEGRNLRGYSREDLMAALAHLEAVGAKAATPLPSHQGAVATT
jgi:hypothetical protein